MVDTVNVINMSMYNLSTRMASGMDSIAVYKATTQSGVYTELTVSATRVTLVSTTQYYTYVDTGASVGSLFYKYKLFNGTASASSYETAAFYGNTSDLTEDLRYQIEDIRGPISNYRYTIKQLRLFVRKALRNLQMLPYRYRYIQSKDGIISPRVYSEQKAIILLQAQLEVIKSQLVVAADTYISFSDGRGRFNNRTSDALKDAFKMLKGERDEMIKNSNDIRVTPERVLMWTATSGVST